MTFLEIGVTALLCDRVIRAAYDFHQGARAVAFAAKQAEAAARVTPLAQTSTSHNGPWLFAERHDKRPS